MAEEDSTEPAEKPKKSKGIIVFALVFLLCAGGGFAAVQFGVLARFGIGNAAPDHAPDSGEPHHPTFETPTAGSYVDIPTVVINLPAGGPHAHLRFTMTLDVPTGSEHQVEELKPRMVDMLNTYLRAIEPSDFERQQALTMIRSHLLARAKVIAGSDHIRDVLIQEFILN